MPECVMVCCHHAQCFDVGLFMYEVFLGVILLLLRFLLTRDEQYLSDWLIVGMTMTL